MSERVRAFFALELTRQAREAIVSGTEALRGVCPQATRWVSTENLHLTLKFLGHLPEQTLPRLCRAVVPRLARTESFELELSGLGAFPSARSARVLWVGVTDGGAEIARLARGLESAAARVGVPRERRPYRGHLTVGRLSEPARVPVERVAAPPPLRVPVREVVLYRSDLSREGARYSPLVRLALGEASELDLESVFTHPEG